MKNFHRMPAALAVIAMAAPAFAHTGHHDANVVANMIHWLSQPSHAVPTVLAAAIIIAGVTFARRQRG